MFLLVVIRMAPIGAACFGVWWRFNNHQEVQYREEGSEKKRSKRRKKYRDTQREKGNSKIVGSSPWGPQKGSKKILKKNYKEYRRCVLKILKW